MSGERLAEKEYQAAAEEHLKEALENSAFEVKDKMAFFKKKWRREHAFATALELLALIGVMAAGFLLDNGLQYAAMIAAYVLSVVKRNQMMAYVEKRAFGETPKPIKE
ncbi:MAG: hypothetical protein IJ792_01230 [Oscillospiraceae bacterium]|nr:hypothetical protein [Oscillospiraceae bacterium]